MVVAAEAETAKAAGAVQVSWALDAPLVRSRAPCCYCIKRRGGRGASSASMVAGGPRDLDLVGDKISGDSVRSSGVS